MKPPFGTKTKCHDCSGIRFLGLKIQILIDLGKNEVFWFSKMIPYLGVLLLNLICQIKTLCFLPLKCISNFLAQDKEVMVISMNEGVEEDVAKLLSQPSSHILLLMDIQFSSLKWRDMLLWRTNQAQKSSKESLMYSIVNV